MFLANLKSHLNSFKAFTTNNPVINPFSRFHAGKLKQSPFMSNLIFSKAFSDITKEEDAIPQKIPNPLEKLFNLSTSSSRRRHFVVIGDTGSGKSSFINTITQKNECVVSSQPQSVTHACQWIETSLPKLSSAVFIDTPGFGDTRPEIKNEDILDIIMSEVLDLNEKTEIAFILCHSVRNTRSHAEVIFENIASRMGPEILKSTMVVLTSANLLKFDSLSQEIHQNFIKFVTEKYMMNKDSIVEFDSVDHLPNQHTNIIKVLNKLPEYDWKQIEFLKEENRHLFNQIQEKDKIEVEVMIPTPVQVEEPGVFKRYYEEEFLHEEKKSQWVGWNYLLLGIPYLITLEDAKTFICRVPLKDTAYNFRVIESIATVAGGDFKDATAGVVVKPDRLELQSNLKFNFARSNSANVIWKLEVEYEYSELIKKTIMVEKKEMKMVPRPDYEIWDRVREYQRVKFREKVRKLKLK